MNLCQTILLKVERASEQTKCNHDVMPPPRKMNRKLIGYVYGRPGD